MILLRVASVVCALFAILTAGGWALNASVAHAVAWLAASVMLYVLSTIPVTRVP